jgi:hypothetical protein
MLRGRSLALGRGAWLHTQRWGPDNAANESAVAITTSFVSRLDSFVHTLNLYCTCCAVRCFTSRAVTSSAVGVKHGAAWRNAAAPTPERVRRHAARFARTARGSSSAVAEAASSYPLSELASSDHARGTVSVYESDDAIEGYLRQRASGRAVSVEEEKQMMMHMLARAARLQESREGAGPSGMRSPRFESCSAALRTRA